MIENIMVVFFTLATLVLIGMFAIHLLVMDQLVKLLDRVSDDTRDIQHTNRVIMEEE